MLADRSKGLPLQHCRARKTGFRFTPIRRFSPIRATLDDTARARASRFASPWQCQFRIFSGAHCFYRNGTIFSACPFGLIVLLRFVLAVAIQMLNAGRRFPGRRVYMIGSKRVRPTRLLSAVDTRRPILLRASMSLYA